MLVNNDIWGLDQDCMVYNGEECTNTASLVNACAWAGCVTASDNISDDPLFINPASGDFHIQVGSPCIDTGISRPCETLFDSVPS